MGLNGHGFAGSTPVVLGKGKVETMNTIALRVSRYKTIMSCDLSDFKSYKYTFEKLKSIGKSKPECYICLRIGVYQPNSSLGSVCEDEILCSPLQEFYLDSTNEWARVCELQPGDKLKSFENGTKDVIDVTLVKGEIDVYMLEVDKLHNYFVGKYAILVQNLVIPWKSK